jgi:hypothetical protein
MQSCVLQVLIQSNTKFDGDSEAITSTWAEFDDQAITICANGSIYSVICSLMKLDSSQVDGSEYASSLGTSGGSSAGTSAFGTSPLESYHANG